MTILLIGGHGNIGKGLCMTNLGNQFVPTSRTNNAMIQLNPLDLDALNKSININGATHMVLNKIDVLEKVNQWKLRHKGKLKSFENQNDMFGYILKNTKFKNKEANVYFSGNKNNIGVK